MGVANSHLTIFIISAELISIDNVLAEGDISETIPGSRIAFVREASHLAVTLKLSTCGFASRSFCRPVDGTLSLYKRVNLSAAQISMGFELHRNLSG